MIQISDLLFRYADSAFALRISSLSIQDGEKVAIVGASGSGKSTLLKLIAGVHLPISGSVDVFGTRVSQLSDAERRRYRISQIGFIFQEFELMEYLSVQENILLPYFIHRSLRLDVATRQRSTNLASEMGLARLLDRPPGQLSHGERQRVAICRALVTRPAIVLADEPTASLDQQTASTILDLLFKQINDNHSTFVCVTHDPSILPKFDRVIPMEEPAIQATIPEPT
jgi:putative ABC transport system ATP-binding protein